MAKNILILLAFIAGLPRSLVAIRTDIDRQTVMQLGRADLGTVPSVRSPQGVTYSPATTSRQWCQAQ